MTREPRLLTNDRGANEMKLGAVDRSTGIYLVTEESPWKPQLWYHLMKAETSLGSCSKLGREMEEKGKDEGAIPSIVLVIRSDGVLFVLS
jgi:hypothetical protein